MLYKNCTWSCDKIDIKTSLGVSVKPLATIMKRLTSVKQRMEEKKFTRAARKQMKSAIADHVANGLLYPIYLIPVEDFGNVYHRGV